MKINKEPLDSRRIAVINSQTSDLHDGVASLNEALVDKETMGSLTVIDDIRTKINILRDQIVNGDITY